MEKANLQLYSVRQFMEKNVADTLAKVAGCGYTGVEFAGYFDVPAADMAKLLKDNGLEAVSNHVKNYQFLQSELDKQIEYLLTIGGRYMVCTNPPMGEKDEIIAGAHVLSEIAEKCKKNGLKFALHNYLPEFGQIDGVYKWDILFENASELVLAEPDIFWIAVCGADPIQYIKKLGSRVALMHLKQMSSYEPKTDVPAPDGVFDFKEFIALGGSLGVTDYVYEHEPENPDTAFDAVKRSCDYILAL